MRNRILISVLVLALSFSFTGCRRIIGLLSKFGDDTVKHGDEAAEMIEKTVKNADSETIKSAGSDILGKTIDAAGTAKDVTEKLSDDE